MEELRAVTARLTPASWANWSAVARTHGVTLAALMEAIGIHLPSIDLPVAVVELAKDIDVERRRRR